MPICAMRPRIERSTEINTEKTVRIMGDDVGFADKIKPGNTVVFRNGGKSIVRSIEPAFGYEDYRRYILFENCNLGITVAITGDLIATDLNQPVPGCPFDIIRIE